MFGSDKSDELSMLNSDNGSASPQWNDENRLTVQLEYFNHSVSAYGSGITHLENIELLTIFMHIIY